MNFNADQMVISVNSPAKLVFQRFVMKMSRVFSHVAVNVDVAMLV